MTAPAEEGQDRLAKLGALAALPEQQFVSRVPLVGRLIAGFRTAWNNVSTRWYVWPLAHQQSVFNQTAVDELAALRAENAALRAELTRFYEWLISQDRDQAELRHDLGELAVQTAQLLRRGENASATPDEETPPPDGDRA